MFYSNVAEDAFMHLARNNGWRATKRGWPDFLCVDPETGDMFAVEVKPRNLNGFCQRLKREQARTLDLLSSKGIQCFVSDGHVLEPYDRAKHRPVRGEPD